MAYQQRAVHSGLVRALPLLTAPERASGGWATRDLSLSSRALLLFDDAFGGLGQKPGSRIAAALESTSAQINRISERLENNR